MPFPRAPSQRSRPTRTDAPYDIPHRSRLPRTPKSFILAEKTQTTKEQSREQRSHKNYFVLFRANLQPGNCSTTPRAAGPFTEGFSIPLMPKFSATSANSPATSPEPSPTTRIASPGGRCSTSRSSPPTRSRASSATPGATTATGPRRLPERPGGPIRIAGSSPASATSTTGRSSTTGSSSLTPARWR